MLEKLNDVLSLFTHERREITPPQAVELLKRPKSTVYRLLARIHEAGFLDQDRDTGAYRLGIRLAALGALSRQAMSIQRTAQPILRDLSEEVEGLVDLTTLVEKEAVVVATVERFQPVMLPGLLGAHVPLHATAAGKALLAWRTREEQLDILRPPLKRFTDRTLEDLSEVVAELDQARERGYTTSAGEWRNEVAAVGAPVRDYRGGVVAAIAVGWPLIRLDEESQERFGQATMMAAGTLSEALGYREP